MPHNPPKNQVTSQEHSSASIQPQTISSMSYANKANSLQGSSPTRLGKLIAQIYRDENIDQVEVVLQKVEKARSRYENSEFFYRAFLPGPPLLVWQLKKLLNSNKVTRQLTETLDPDYIALLTYNVLYGVWAIFGLAMILTFSLKRWDLPWWWITGILFLILWGVRFYWYDSLIRDTRCVKLYDDFRNAIAQQAEKARQFVTNICDLYNKVNSAENESKVNRILDQIQVNNRENYRRLELESMENLQALEASVAYAQVQDEQLRQKLKNETELEYMAAKYQITGEGIQAQAHQITLAMIQQEENILVEMAKALGTDEQKNREMMRHIQKETAILAALKGDLQRNGREAYRHPDFEERLQELSNTRAKRYKSTTEK